MTRQGAFIVDQEDGNIIYMIPGHVEVDENYDCIICEHKSTIEYTGLKLQSVQVGDVIQCVNNTEAKFLTVGDKYIIKTKSTHEGDNFVELIDDRAKAAWYDVGRFVKA